MKVLIVLFLVQLVSVYASTSCPKLASCQNVKAKSGTTRSAPNGCGSKLYNIDVPEFDFGTCCNDHDSCYSNCESTFESCNDKFASCMSKVCRQKHFIEGFFCRSAAKSYAEATKSKAGCAAYTSGANDYCMCA